MEGCSDAEKMSFRLSQLLVKEQTGKSREQQQSEIKRETDEQNEIHSCPSEPETREHKRAQEDAPPDQKDAESSKEHSSNIGDRQKQRQLEIRREIEQNEIHSCPSEPEIRERKGASEDPPDQNDAESSEEDSSNILQILESLLSPFHAAQFNNKNKRFGFLIIFFIVCFTRGVIWGYIDGIFKNLYGRGEIAKITCGDNFVIDEQKNTMAMRVNLLIFSGFSSLTSVCFGTFAISYLDDHFKYSKSHIGVVYGLIAAGKFVGSIFSWVPLMYQPVTFFSSPLIRGVISGFNTISQVVRILLYVRTVPKNYKDLILAADVTVTKLLPYIPFRYITKRIIIGNVCENLENDELCIFQERNFDVFITVTAVACISIALVFAVLHRDLIWLLDNALVANCI